MKLLLKFICLVFIVNNTFSQLPDNYKGGVFFPEDATDIVPKTIIAKLNDENFHLRDLESLIHHPKFSKVYQALDVSEFREIFPFISKEDKKYNELGEKLANIAGIYEIKYQSNIELSTALRWVYSTNLFYYVQPEFEVHPIAENSFTPNDPLLGNQWYLNTIKAFDAWGVNQGNPNIIVASVDGGVNITHPDMINNLYINTADPIDGIDNDGDGFIDNYYGWDFGGNDGNVSPENTNLYFVSQHGVIVSGIHGATPDNSLGIAGTGYNCKYLPVKIGRVGANAYTRSYEGMLYGALRADVVNCSWGGINQLGPYENDIVNYCTINLKKLIVAAAGNDGNDPVAANRRRIRFPAGHENVLAIGMTNPSDQKRAASTWSHLIDMMAPGENIWTTGFSNNYINGGSGTSYAAPIVSGAAAVTKSQFPTLDMIQIREKIKYAVDDISAIPANLPFLDSIGTGRLNYHKAVLPTNISSFKFINREYESTLNNGFPVGDTVFIKGNFINYLEASGPATVANISSNSPFVQFIEDEFNIGSVNTLANVNNYSAPFSFTILPGCPAFHTVTFRIDVNDGIHTTRQYFDLLINVDYININHNKISTTLTSTGRNGFRDEINRRIGEGLRFENQPNYLFWSGLMAGSSNTKVSDQMVGSVFPFFDNDFVTISSIRRITSNISDADYSYQTIFNDNNAPTPQNILITQNNFVWENAPNDNFVIFEYIIKNNGVDLIDNFYAGLFNYFEFFSDIFQFIPYNLNYLASKKVGYFNANGINPDLIYGFKILTNGNPTNYANHPQGLIGNSINWTNGFTTNEKYHNMTQGLTQPSILNNSSSQFIGEGPFSISPGASIKVAIAMIVTDGGLTELETIADAAQDAYDQIGQEWMGNIDSNWNNPNNWSRVSVPSVGDKIVINASTHNPILPSGITSLENVEIKNGATLNFQTDSELEITGNFIDLSTTHRDFGNGSITFNGNSAQNFSGKFSIGSLIINNNSGVNIENGSDIRIKDELKLENGNFIVPSNANITLLSNATNTAFLNDFGSNNGVYVGEINIQRLMTHPGSQKRFHFIGSAVSNASVAMWAAGFPLEPLNGAVDGSQLVPQANCSQLNMAFGSPYGNLQEYRENTVTTCEFAGWHVRLSGLLLPGRGYAARVNSGTFANSKGNPNTGNVSLNNLTRTNTNLTGPGKQGFNMVANPYPSGLSWDLVATENPQLSATAYVFNPNNNTFMYYHPIANPNQILASGQGFQVELLNGPTGHISFNNNQRIAASDPTFFNQNQSLQISISNGNHSDVWYLSMNEIYTNNWNQRWDAYKKELDANLSEIYSIKSNQKTAIHTLEYEHNIQIPIHFKCKVNGLYNLNVNGVDNNYLWTLTDHKENTTYNLLNTNSFEFTANTTDNLHRFTLNGIEIPFFETHQNDCESVGNIMLYNHSNSEWILSISDELGNTVINHQLYDSLSVENLSAGTYTVIFTNPEYLFEKIETFVIEEVTVPVANFELSSNTYQVDEFIYFQNNSINATNYFWEFGDGMESTLQNPSHSYSNAGTYTVKLLSNSELCFDEFSQNITIIPSLGLVDWNDSEITFFVNNKKAYVNIPAFKNAPYYLNIFDLTGKMVKSIQINNAYSILDLSDLKIGIYAFNLYNNQFSESYKRFID